MFWNMSKQSMGQLLDTFNEVKECNLPPVCGTQLTAPGRPVLQSKTHDLVTLNWIKPKGDPTQVKHYAIYYRENVASNGEWHQDKTTGNELIATISNLQGCFY